MVGRDDEDGEFLGGILQGSGEVVIWMSDRLSEDLGVDSTI